MLDQTPIVIVSNDADLFDNPPLGTVVVALGVDPNDTDSQD